MEREIVWNDGDENRPLQLRRPCSCGCDERGDATGVGYLTGSDADGNGFTLWIESELVYQRLEEALADVVVTA